MFGPWTDACQLANQNASRTKQVNDNSIISGTEADSSAPACPFKVDKAPSNVADAPGTSVAPAYNSRDVCDRPRRDDEAWDGWHPLHSRQCNGWAGAKLGLGGM